VLDESAVDPDPLVQVAAWYAEARAAMGEDADHLVVATAASDGQPSARVVLLRSIDAAGLCFYTNYQSRKGRELAANPRAALLLHWAPLHRQVRMTGAVHRLDTEASDRYWRNRPRASRLSALASRQSEPVADRASLEAEVARVAAQHPDDVPRPPFWGGYRVVPADVELWEHRDDRLHDRVRYRRAGDGWVIDRLAP
jgi:pyridoxamine 5'-phosphate oxidase